MTKKNSSAATRHVLAAILAVLFSLGFQPQAISEETDEDNSTRARGQEREREMAEQELQLAHETTETARSAVASAKLQLDDFIARHFDEHQLRGAAPLPTFQESRPASTTTVNPQEEQLKQQLAELKMRREDLLTRLMPAHPDVAQVDDQIAALWQRLASERPRAKEPAWPGVAEGVDAANGNLAEYLSYERQRHQQSASAYAEILARCQTAERDMQAAIEGERLAAQRLAKIKTPVGPVVAMPPPIVNTLPMQAPSVSRPAAKVQQQGSQPLALAVLLIALVVAALAAVKLARSSTDAVFANAAQLSATLALPVVGIIPAAQMASCELPAASQFRRGTQLLAEVLLALVVFVTVAYLVQNPLSIWQICTDPMDGLSRMTRFFRMN